MRIFHRTMTLVTLVTLVTPLLFAWPAPALADDPVDLEGLERDVDRRINRYRESTNRSPFEWNDSIAKIARRHSEAMAKGKASFGHDGLKKRSEKIQKKFTIAGMAENVSKHQRSSGFAEAAVTRWLKSPAHLKNIDGDYDLSGIGAARSADGTVYFTQLFVKLRAPASP
jgi:uncharacterized protein YkwD